MQPSQVRRIGENVFLERVVAELWANCVRLELMSDTNLSAHFRDRSQPSIPQLVRQIFFSFADLLQMLVEPPFSTLRM